MKKRDVTKVYGAKAFAKKLKRLAKALEAGKSATFQVAGKKVRIPAHAEISVEHEKEKGRQELEFQLRW